MDENNTARTWDSYENNWNSYENTWDSYENSLDFLISVGISCNWYGSEDIYEISRREMNTPYTKKIYASFSSNIH